MEDTREPCDLVSHAVPPTYTAGKRGLSSQQEEGLELPLPDTNPISAFGHTALAGRWAPPLICSAKSDNSK